MCHLYAHRGPRLLAFSLDRQGHWAPYLVVRGLCVCLELASSILGAELWPSCCVSLSHCLWNMPVFPVSICQSSGSLLSPEASPHSYACGLPRHLEVFLRVTAVCTSVEFHLTWVYEFDLLACLTLSLLFCYRFWFLLAKFWNFELILRC